MSRIILFFILSSFSCSIFSQPELKGSPQELRQFLYPADKIVTIQAEAEERAYTDKAIVSLVITTQDKVLSRSISINSSLREDITSALIDSGINQDSIKNSKFSSSPEYGWFGNKPSSYKVINRMTISITKEKQMKEIALITDRYQEAEISDIAFEYTRKDTLKEKVEAKALAKILQRKEIYERSLGLKLTAVGVRNLNVFPDPTRGALALEEIIATGQTRTKSGHSAVVQGIQSSEPSFDEVKYKVEMSVDFKIE